MKMIDVNDKIRAKVEALPDSPGVYRWKDKDGRVIYVGKAKNLKNRVRSYVREDKNRSPKVAAMIRHAEDLDITMTATEMEALILECNLIKEIHPKYNISLRDDKSYPYIFLSADTHPRLATDDVVNLVVPIPDMTVQMAIAAEVQRRRELARRLRAEAEAGWSEAKRWFEEQLLGPAP